MDEWRDWRKETDRQTQRTERERETEKRTGQTFRGFGSQYG